MTEAVYVLIGVGVGAALTVLVLVALVNRKEAHTDALRAHMMQSHGVDEVGVDQSGDFLRGLHGGIHAQVSVVEQDRVRLGDDNPLR